MGGGAWVGITSPRSNGFSGTTSPGRKTSSAGVMQVVGPEGEHLFEAEKVKEGRRDFRYRQENPDLDGLLTPQSTILSRNASQRSFGDGSLKPSLSQKSLSAATLVSVQNPVHSVRARPGAAAKQRWK